MDTWQEKKTLRFTVQKKLFSARVANLIAITIKVEEEGEGTKQFWQRSLFSSAFSPSPFQVTAAYGGLNMRFLVIFVFMVS